MLRGSPAPLTSRYTRNVGWRQRISALVLVVLAGLPVSGALCAIVCDSGANATSSHHGSSKNCEEPAGPLGGLQIQALSEHDCANHDGVVGQIAVPATERTALDAASALSGAAVPRLSISASLPSRAATAFASPPGPVPLTTTPLVLRV